MKLLRIDHERCQEYECASYIWVPDEFGYVDDGEVPDALYEAVERAEKAYLADAQAYKDEAAKGKPENPGYALDIKKYPETWTIREAKKDFSAKKDAYERFTGIQRRAQKSFTSYLVAEIPGSKHFEDAWDWDGEDELPEVMRFTQDWGHRHGTHIDYGETKISDLKGAGSDG